MGNNDAAWGEWQRLHSPSGRPGSVLLFLSGVAQAHFTLCASAGS